VGEAAGESLELAVGGTVRFGGEAVALIDAAFTIPTGLLFMVPPPPPCTCPVGTPASTTANVLHLGALRVPDAAPPPGMTPSANPVATLTVEILGPKVGECCLTGARTFEAKFSVDSMVGGANNTTTAAFMSLLAITASTNGAAHAVGNGPNNNPAAGREERETRFDVPIACDVPACVCALATAQFVTKLVMGGAGAGSAEVHWSLTIASNAADCVISAVTATVDRVVYTRFGDVYDPVGDRMLNKLADQDGDGTNNYDEVDGGFDPGNPASHP
jgi:hypothetical protein